MVKHSVLRYPDGSDYVECSICGYRAKELILHVKSIHKISVEDYKNTYNTKIRSNEILKGQSERLKGDKNPAYQHGGKFSPWSDKSVVHSKDQILKSKKKASDTRTVPSQLEYYLSKGLTHEEAIKEQSKFQAQFSLEKCIEKYGKEKGQQRWKDRQIKWSKSYKSSNYSKASQNLFSKLYSTIGDKYGKVYFHDNNGEYVLQTDKSVIKPDFYIPDLGKIIEFDGYYWHTIVGNSEREKKRDKSIKDLDLKVLHVKENDFTKNENQVLQECLTFLTQ